MIFKVTSSPNLSVILQFYEFDFMKINPFWESKSSPLCRQLEQRYSLVTACLLACLWVKVADRLCTVQIHAGLNRFGQFWCGYKLSFLSGTSFCRLSDTLNVLLIRCLSLDFPLHHDLTSWIRDVSLSNFLTNRFCHDSLCSTPYAFFNW